MSDEARLDEQIWLDPDGFADYLEELLALGALEDPAAGVARQVVGKGYDSLTERQRGAIAQALLPDHFSGRCRLGGHRIAWDEMLVARGYGWMCPTCHAQFEKDD